nr:MAG TPA: hypothetical protein [Caudoviricetes sp.]
MLLYGWCTFHLRTTSQHLIEFCSITHLMIALLYTAPHVYSC